MALCPILSNGLPFSVEYIVIQHSGACQAFFYGGREEMIRHHRLCMTMRDFNSISNANLSIELNIEEYAVESKARKDFSLFINQKYASAD